MQPQLRFFNAAFFKECFENTVEGVFVIPGPRRNSIPQSLLPQLQNVISGLIFFGDTMVFTIQQDAEFLVGKHRNCSGVHSNKEQWILLSSRVYSSNHVECILNTFTFPLLHCSIADNTATPPATLDVSRRRRPRVRRWTGALAYATLQSYINI